MSRVRVIRRSPRTGISAKSMTVLPKVGEEVTVVCKRSDLERKVSLVHSSKYQTFYGTIYPTQSWQKARKSLNLTTGNNFFPWREIPLHTIVSITHGNNTIKVKIEKPHKKIYKVKGSTGTIYNVLKSNGAFSCDCIGFKFHGNCKHIKAVNKT